MSSIEASNGENLSGSLKGLTHSYSKYSKLLSNLKLDIASGEQVALLGPSGAGKSTILGILAGRIAPNEGEVKTCKTATIYQDLRLVQQRTAFQNVKDGTLAMKERSSNPKAEDNLVRDLLRKVGLESKENVLVSKLSGGEKQRVAVARALMQAPEMILADEPVASLDRRSAQRVMKLLSSLCREQGISLVCVMHDERLAESFFDSAYLLEEGSLDKVEIENLSPRIAESLLVPEAEGRSRQKSESTSYRTLFLVGAVVLASFLPAFFLNFNGISFGEALGNLWAFFSQIFGEQLGGFIEVPFRELSQALWETILMAFMATGLATLITLPISAFAAGNSGLRIFNQVVRFLLNFLRTVPSIIWALIFVAAIGLGPLAGVLALTAYSVGYVGKFFYEAFELVEPGPVEALKEIGATPKETFVRAIWPQAVPAVLGHFLFMLEYNIRSASVLGVVDAGGIGFYLKQYLDLRFFPAVVVGLLMIFFLVVLVDLLSAKLRKAYLPNRAC